MKVDDKYLQRLGVLPYERPRARRGTRARHLFANGIRPFHIPEDVEIFGQRVVTEHPTRRLNAQWTVELAEDLQAMHGINVEEELVQAMTAEIEADQPPEDVPAEPETDESNAMDALRMMRDWMRIVRSR